MKKQNFQKVQFSLQQRENLPKQQIYLFQIPDSIKPEELNNFDFNLTTNSIANFEINDKIITLKSMDDIGTKYLTNQMLVLTPNDNKMASTNKLAGIFKLFECQKVEEKQPIELKDENEEESKVTKVKEKKIVKEKKTANKRTKVKK